MKTFAMMSALMAAALAAPTTPTPGNSFLTRVINPLNKKLCPANPAQPDGKLPKGSISTSLLVPISAKNPSKVYPATEWATITANDLCTIFNLELDFDAVQGKILQPRLRIPRHPPSTRPLVFYPNKVAPVPH